MPQYSVLIPIAGHIEVLVKAENEDAAIEAAFESDDLKIDNLFQWEAVQAFTQGNVCYCPHPWEAEAQEVG